MQFYCHFWKALFKSLVWSINMWRVSTQSLPRGSLPVIPNPLFIIPLLFLIIFPNLTVQMQFCWLYLNFDTKIENLNVVFLKKNTMKSSNYSHLALFKVSSISFQEIWHWHIRCLHVGQSTSSLLFPRWSFIQVCRIFPCCFFRLDFSTEGFTCPLNRSKEKCCFSRL